MAVWTRGQWGQKIEQQRKNFIDCALKSQFYEDIIFDYIFYNEQCTIYRCSVTDRGCREP